MNSLPEINWLLAPEGTTHARWSISFNGYFWYKLTAGKWCWWDQKLLGWMLIALDPSVISDMIAIESDQERYSELKELSELNLLASKKISQLSKHEPFPDSDPRSKILHAWREIRCYVRVAIKAHVGADGVLWNHSTKYNHHVIYRNGDKDIPDVILDRNGHVARAMCKRCGKAESELSEPCPNWKQS